MKDRILIVEDNSSIARKLLTGIGNTYGIPADVISSYNDLQALLKEQSDYTLALCDLNLPDAPDGESLSLLVKYAIPTIVMTASMDKELRKTITSKPIIDYVGKEHPEDMAYLINRVGEIIRNKAIKVLMVDDSTLARTIMRKLLKIQQFIVFEAADGVEALDIIDKNPDIKVVLTDYNMPNMDGLELTINLRHRYSRDTLAIIAISSENDSEIASHLLKLGANDFIHKPFVKEEFDCRINNTVRALENLETILNLADKDFLTGLYNRRGFFKRAEKLFDTARQDHTPISTAMFDLDNFKLINDTYGHEVGDHALQHFTQILQKHMHPGDLAARLGGEEFCVITKRSSHAETIRYLDSIRTDIEKTPVKQGNGRTIRFTVSIGVCTEPKENLIEMINSADKALYKAKITGKNRISDTP